MIHDTRSPEMEGVEGECQSESDDYSGAIKDKCSSSPEYYTGIYGWRRRCLLVVIILLCVTVTINLALSLWLLKLMYLSRSGMGAMRIHPGGLQLDGEAMLLDKLVASKITGRPGEPVRLESFKSISLQTRNQAEESSSGKITAKLLLSEDRLDVMASTLKISDPRGNLLFDTSNSNAITVGSESLHILGEGGGRIEGSLQVPKIRPRNGQDLKLESPTRSLKIFALQGISVVSQVGDVNANCRTDIKVESMREHVTLDTDSIYLPKVETALTQSNFSNWKSPTPFSPSNTHNILNENFISESKQGTVFQVCMCNTGRLFLAPPEAPCVVDKDICR